MEGWTNGRDGRVQQTQIVMIPRIAHLQTQPVLDDFALAVARVLVERVVERTLVDVVGDVAYE
jgi:hypothetical protein